MTTTDAPTLFDHPADPTVPVDGAARHSDPLTSHLAATSDSNRMRWGSQRFLLLRAIAGAGTDGLTDEEAGKTCGIRRVADTRRCSELRKAGLIVVTSETRKTSTDSDAVVCRVTQAGLDALRAVRP